MGRTIPLKERILNKVLLNQTTGCIEWTACISPNGYGKIQTSKGASTAHRVAWTVFVGEIPSGLCVLHKCFNKKCVNIDHLYLGTYKNNLHYRNKRREQSTHCSRGHEHSVENTYINKYGHRKCRVCRRIWLNNFKEKYGHSYLSLWRLSRSNR